MESKSKSQMRRLEAQIPDYAVLIRVVRAAEELKKLDDEGYRWSGLACQSRVLRVIEALEALPEHLKAVGHGT